MSEIPKSARAYARHWTLRIREPEGEETSPRELEVRPGSLIGRAGEDSSVDIALDDPRVSEFHARVVELNGGLGLEDLNSTNGTRIDGARLAPFRPIQVHDGSELRIGRSWLEVRAPREAPAEEQEPSAAPAPPPPVEAAIASEIVSQIAPAAESELLEPSSIQPIPSPPIPAVPVHPEVGSPDFVPPSDPTHAGPPDYDDSEESIERLRQHRIRIATCHEADELRGIFDVLHPIYRIGRGQSAGNDLAFDYDGVSRAHAELLWDGHQIWIADRASRHGTWIGDVQLPSTEVQFSKIAPLRPRAMVGNDMVLQFGPLEALLVADLDEADRPPMAGLYEKALDLLVRKQRISTEQRKRAEEAATARRVHPGEILISGPEALRPAVWVQMLRLAEVQLLSLRNRS